MVRAPFEQSYDAMVERIDLAKVHSACRQRWANGDLWDPETTCVLVGEVAGGWYTRWYGRGPLRPGACVWTRPHAEWYAQRTARCWMRTIGGTWVEA